MGRLKENASAQPFFMATVMLLFALSCMFCPDNLFGDSLNGKLLAGMMFRMLFAGLAVVFLVRMGLAQTLRFHGDSLRFADILAVAFLICVNNTPFAAVAAGNVSVTQPPLTVAIFALHCLSVGLFEELFFRGLILSLLLRGFSQTKLGKLGAIALSSAVFGLTHLLNLLGGAGIGAVLAQIGYSALLGALLALVQLTFRCIWLPAVLHALYNFGGLLFDTVGQGQIWTIPQIVLTAVVAVCAAAYLSVRFALCKRLPVVRPLIDPQPAQADG